MQTPAASRAARQFRRIDAGVIPAQPHFQRDRHAHGGDGCLDQGQGVIEIAHQRRAGGAVGDLLGRAAHVDVDDVRALRLRDAGAFRHPMRPRSRRAARRGWRRPAPRCARAPRAGPGPVRRRRSFPKPPGRRPAVRPAGGRAASVMPDIGAKITRFGTVTGPICRDFAAIWLDFAPHGMTAYHLGGPFHCSEFSHFDSGRKCCTAKSCSCLNRACASAAANAFP